MMAENSLENVAFKSFLEWDGPITFTPVFAYQPID